MPYFKEERFYICSESKVPRIYLYMNEVSKKKIGIGGVDYLGYIILDHKTEKPYYIMDGKRIYLNENQIKEMRNAKKRKTSYAKTA